MKPFHANTGTFVVLTHKEKAAFVKEAKVKEKTLNDSDKKESHTCMQREERGVR